MVVRQPQRLERHAPGGTRLMARPAPRDAVPDAPEPAPDTGAVRVGISGWVYSPWRNTFYPRHLPHRRELEYASHCLRTLEINSTSYGSETPSTYARWAAETPADFVFSVRAPRQVTERGALGRTQMAVRAFVQGGLEALGPRLGPIVWQLPPNREFDAADLAAFFELLPRTLQGHPLHHVIDAKHPSFLKPDYLELARAHAVATAQCDTEGPLDAGRITAPVAYVRLMRARAAEPLGYGTATLAAHADELAAWVSAGDARAASVFVYFAGGARQRDPAAAMALARLLAERRAQAARPQA